MNNIIFSSPLATYGSVDSGNMFINENNELNPQNPYAESKIKTEKFLLNHQDDFKYIILRYFNVAGADDKLRSGQISKKSTHLIKVLSEVIQGKKKSIKIFGNDYNTKDGTAIRDYIHVTDLADIHVKAAEHLMSSSKSNIFNCGYGKGFSVLDVINKANEIYDNKVNFSFSKEEREM